MRPKKGKPKNDKDATGSGGEGDEGWGGARRSAADEANNANGLRSNRANGAYERLVVAKSRMPLFVVWLTSFSFFFFLSLLLLSVFLARLFVCASSAVFFFCCGIFVVKCKWKSAVQTGRASPCGWPTTSRLDWTDRRGDTLKLATSCLYTHSTHTHTHRHTLCFFTL